MENFHNQLPYFIYISLLLWNKMSAVEDNEPELVVKTLLMRPYVSIHHCDE